ncbi:MAG: RsmD family RNA methyltransferase [Bacteroidales bacterium]|nr:RsmD family RNA methyltransferase [Bacteroidales bacterium]
MRIISGIHKGRTIIPDKKFSARPTTDFAKEGLFDILASRLDFENLKVLDLFSGTGGISYEFASRGCPLVHAVEQNPLHAAFISQTKEKLSLNTLKVFKADVFRFIESSRQQYNLIFADPPYDMERVPELPDLILNLPILELNGIFILEHSRNIHFLEHENLIDARHYGSVNFSFFKKV